MCYYSQSSTDARFIFLSLPSIFSIAIFFLPYHALFVQVFIITRISDNAVFKIMNVHPSWDI